MNETIEKEQQLKITKYLFDYAQDDEERKIIKFEKIDALTDKYLEFYSATFSNRKTPIVIVFNKIFAEIIGKIKWYPEWRQYCFFTEDEIIVHSGCMYKVLECIEYLKKEQEANKS